MWKSPPILRTHIYSRSLALKGLGRAELTRSVDQRSVQTLDRARERVNMAINRLLTRVCTIIERKRLAHYVPDACIKTIDGSFVRTNDRDYVPPSGIIGGTLN